VDSWYGGAISDTLKSPLARRDAFINYPSTFYHLWFWKREHPSDITDAVAKLWPSLNHNLTSTATYTRSSLMSSSRSCKNFPPGFLTHQDSPKSLIVVSLPISCCRSTFYYRDPTVEDSWNAAQEMDPCRGRRVFPLLISSQRGRSRRRPS